jgi:hypothetical protein
MAESRDCNLRWIMERKIFRMYGGVSCKTHIIKTFGNEKVERGSFMQ